MLDRTFGAVVFDWDGTAVPDRASDASDVRHLVHALCAAGVHVIVVSGTHLGNIDGQLRARPNGPGSLHLCLNRGSEVFEVDREGPTSVWQEPVDPAEEAALDEAASATVALLAERGLRAAVVSNRLNRRKVDLIPEPDWADPPKARLDALLEAVSERLSRAGISTLAEAVRLAVGAARSAGIAEPRVTSDVKHVEIGLTDKSDSARWAAAWLADRGVTGGLVLVVGDELGPLGGVRGSDANLLVRELDRAVVVSVGIEPGGVTAPVEHLAGGPARFRELLCEQVERHRTLRVPWVDEDPAWVVALPADRHLERVAESLGAIGSGLAGLRASREEHRDGSAPSFAMNGVFDAGEPTALVEGPVWSRLDLQAPGADRRLLDLRTGLLVRDVGGGVRTARFLSAARPCIGALRAEGPPDQLAPGPLQVTSSTSRAPTSLEPDGTQIACTRGEGGGICVATRDRITEVRQDLRTVERLAGWSGSVQGAPESSGATAALREAGAVGFDLLLAEQRGTWARRWADAAVTIRGDPSSELGARLAVAHLLAAAPEGGEAAVGARGLTGPAYGGHVFWDADVFVLPVLAATLPAAARAMLEYRIRRLPRACSTARETGHSGSRFPWESAADGSDATPRRVRGRDGRWVEIHTGQREEHIVADVAWSACEYGAWTGDRSFLRGPGRGLVVETARYWASRVEIDADGTGHLRGTMGPDEYHEVVDDNAFTNVMARWNLRRGADLLQETGGSDAEAAAWRDIADRLTDGWDPDRGLHEQFAGYWDLEPLLVAPLARPPVAMDALLGADRVRGSQLIKQADVVMLHHLVPEEARPGALRADLAFYEPRTAHGSSLSPGIHAALLARDGQVDRALDLFRVAARLDLDDLTGTTAGGVHLATMGSVWQALVLGFLGLRPMGRGLRMDPHLPAAWESLELRLRFGGQRIGVDARHDRVAISCARPIDVHIAGGAPVECRPPGRTIPLEGPRP